MKDSAIAYSDIGITLIAQVCACRHGRGMSLCSYFF